MSVNSEAILKAQCLDGCFMPELGKVKKGKVRDIYFKDDNVVMIATDRVSAFDQHIPNLIPYKGMLLNKIAKYAFDSTESIIPNALVTSPDPNVVIQKKVENLQIECIVRGYMWGSMAAAYEKGEREFCGLKLKDGLLRYQKLDEPLFTPTTKGDVDEPMTFKEVEDKIGAEMAARVRKLSFELYAKGCEVAAKANPPLVFIDTKYEFGLDKDGNLLLIDEVNTPDSSRMCDVSEWETKFPKIQEAAKASGKNVTEVLKENGSLKVKEYSKQYVRDILLENGYSEGKPVPKLSNEQVVECTSRYIQIYERLTSQKFDYPEFTTTAKLRLFNSMKSSGIIKGYCAMIFAGSNSDLGHMQKLSDALDAYGIPSKKRICSAHKQPGQLEETVEMYNTSVEPICIIGCAGGTDALSGTASFSSMFPVISCPPDGKNDSCINNPPGSSNSYIYRPANVAKHVAQLFSIHDPAIGEILVQSNAKKVADLKKADAELW
eukprot:TRINITY_DN27382_c0_g1_i1.p1 TRINITY_DN27382_c0_g1~~TRINITY_DN27382_c0_g1_i1.p1  ORF type:complete len:491 (+),score=123.27 TRINITY_DN27382_c0_g1_i1:63-1535(+)